MLPTNYKPQPQTKPDWAPIIQSYHWTPELQKITQFILNLYKKS